MLNFKNDKIDLKDIEFGEEHHFLNKTFGSFTCYSNDLKTIETFLTVCSEIQTSRLGLSEWKPLSDFTFDLPIGDKIYKGCLIVSISDDTFNYVHPNELKDDTQRHVTLTFNYGDMISSND